jgi:quinol monooxygenase YgiN
MSPAVAMFVQAHTTEANRAVARAIVEGLVQPTLAEDGCLQYAILNDLDDPNHIVLLEEWTTPEALAVHNANPVFLEKMGRLMPLLDSEGSGLRLTRAPAAPTPVAS